MKKYILATITTLSLGLSATVSNAAVLALSGNTVIASNEPFAPSFTADLAFDNDFATRAYIDGANWIYVDLGAKYEIDKVSIDFEFSSGQIYEIYVFDGLTAPDPVANLGDWTLIGSIDRTGIDGNGGTYDDVFDFDAGTVASSGSIASSAATVGGGSGNFLLISFQSDVAAGGKSIWEVGVEATAIPEPGTSALLSAFLALCFVMARRRA